MYGREFMSTLSVEQAAAVVLHENLHVMLKHISRHKDLIKEDAQLANAAMDYVVNDIIMQIQDKTLCQLPNNCLHDIKFRNWSVREIYNFLKTGRNPDGSSDGDPVKGNDTVRVNNRYYSIKGQDEHDDSSMQEATAEEIEKIHGEIDQAIQQSALLAGAVGAEIPRALKEMLEPSVDWRAVLDEFISTHTVGRDEYTFAKFNRRRLGDDMYMPSINSERIGEIVVAIDTSGSITGKMVSLFAGELTSICSSMRPEKVRVLWWDTKVHGEQVFESNYENIADMLKPMGGGGTQVSCVNNYIKERNINAECIVVFTDGYLETHIDWHVGSPTLWLVTENAGFIPPKGKVVKFNKV
jgi:predicted metal-dependent peptidase